MPSGRADVEVPDVVPGVVPAQRRIVTAQQAVDLRVKEDVGGELGHAPRGQPRLCPAAGTRHGTPPLQALEARLTERVPAREHLRLVSDPGNLLEQGETVRYLRLQEISTAGFPTVGFPIAEFPQVILNNYKNI